MHIQSKHGVSCTEYGEGVVYGLWNRELYIENLTESGAFVVVEMEAPVLSVHRLNQKVYAGDVDGSVWEVERNTAKRLFTRKSDTSTAPAVLSITSYKNTLACVFHHGEIVLYSTSSCAISKVVRTSSKIESVFGEERMVIYVTNRTQIEMYNLESGVRTKRKSLLENAPITAAVVLGAGDREVLAYGTAVGKVAIDYLTEGVDATSYVFKAHKKEKGGQEVFYPVTMLKGVGPSELVTGGMDGNIYTWDIKQRKRTTILYKSEKSIIAGTIKTEATLPPKIMIVTGSPIDISHPEETTDVFTIEVLTV
ncbi:hypothetical protein NEDG_01146 [Nematocida displodere]|uniref:Uncharacterized protein n=1 Tax=Nematocida displodere TaxID=1805483 RepID=A0A177EAP7_9MICR|nr:hypothetical protein NEDG_01146 [Nematocida displodere]